MLSDGKLETVSGNTLLLSNVGSDEKVLSGIDVPNHTTPQIKNNKLLPGHGNTRHNVAKFIKDHDLGSRHMYKDKSKTTAMDTVTGREFASDGFASGTFHNTRRTSAAATARP